MSAGSHLHVNSERERCVLQTKSPTDSILERSNLALSRESIEAAERLTDARRTHAEVGVRMAAVKLEYANAATAVHLAISDLARAMAQPRLEAPPAAPRGSLSARARELVLHALAERTSALTASEILAFAQAHGWNMSEPERAALYAAIGKLTKHGHIESEGTGRDRIYATKVRST